VSLLYNGERRHWVAGIHYGNVADTNCLCEESGHSGAEIQQVQEQTLNGAGRARTCSLLSRFLVPEPSASQKGAVSVRQALLFVRVRARACFHALIGVTVALVFWRGWTLLSADPYTLSGPAWFGLTKAKTVGAGDLVRTQPIQLRVHIPKATTISSVELARVLHKVQPLPQHMPASIGLHLLMAYGLDAEFQHSKFRSSEDLLRLFTDERFAAEYLDAPTLFRSRYGIRAASHREFTLAGEQHYDQVLGSLGQLGLPLSYQLIVGGERFSLADLLLDSIACFELHQDEIEWTAIAYALYLPPRREWTNKFGERFSFVDLAGELLTRDLRQSSCCGTHILEAMLTMLRVDTEVTPILNATTRAALRRRLSALFRSALQTQCAHGSWPSDWWDVTVSRASCSCGQGSGNDQIAHSLLATSHLTQMFISMPRREPIMERCVVRACTWLYEILERADSEFVQENFCACSHAAWVFRNILEARGERDFANIFLK